MERKYRHELAELKKAREEEGSPQTEDDLFRRLDMLELEEELNDELARYSLSFSVSHRRLAQSDVRIIKRWISR